ncbi:MAG: hypothetical protein ABWY16_11945, partial [Pedobacter sp.]|uniref:hypothetical protein n=1 Tax=Pedobacter sp. TaxID=1411316 RepID=UPI003393717F
GKIEDINIVELGILTTPNGGNVTAMNISDGVIEICAEIIKLVLKEYHPNNDKIPSAPGEIPANLHKLFRLGGMVYDLKTTHINQ